MTTQFAIIKDNRPLPFNDLQAMDIVFQLERVLIVYNSSSKNPNMMAIFLQVGIKTTPAKVVIKTVQDLIRDNPNSMYDLLGKDLFQTVKNFK